MEIGRKNINLSSKALETKSFKGLSRTYAKIAFQEPFNALVVAKMYPKSTGIIGNLPNEWIKEVPIAQRKAKIEEICAAIGKAAKEYRKSVAIMKGSIITDCNIFNRALHKELQLPFLKFGYNDLKVNLVGQGSFGEAYLLKIDGFKQYVIKVFYSLTPDTAANGNFAEQNRAMFWQKHAGKNSQKAKFMFGSLKDGYMVSEYVDNVQKIRTTIPEAVFGLKNRDVALRNIKNGVEVDYGSLEVVSKILSRSKRAQYIVKQFAKISKTEATNKWFSFYNNPKYKDDFEAKIGLITSIKYLPQKDRFECISQFFNAKDDNIKACILDAATYMPIDKIVEVMQKCCN